MEETAAADIQLTGCNGHPVQAQVEDTHYIPGHSRWYGYLCYDHTEVLCGTVCGDGQSLDESLMSISEVGEQKAPAMSQEAIINTEMQLLTSMDLAGKVCCGHGCREPFSRNLQNQPLPQTTMLEAATLKFRQNVFVKDIKRSNLIEVYFRHANPVVAAKAVNILVDLFKRSTFRSSATRRPPFSRNSSKRTRTS